MSGPTSNGRVSFNKFAWLKVMQSDTTLPDTAFRIGVAICTTFTRADGTGWAFDLDDLAAEMGGRAFAQNTVKAAVSQLVSRGHVVETYRSHGGRGCRWRASFDLKPVRQDVRVSEEPARSDVRVSTEPARADVRLSGGNPHVQTTKPARLDVKTRTFGRTKNSPDLREDPVSGTSSGTSTGGARARRNRQHLNRTRSATTPPGTSRSGTTGRRHPSTTRSITPTTTRTAQRPTTTRHQHSTSWRAPPNCRRRRAIGPRPSRNPSRRSTAPITPTTRPTSATHAGLRARRNRKRRLPGSNGSRSSTRPAPPRGGIGSTPAASVTTSTATCLDRTAPCLTTRCGASIRACCRRTRRGQTRSRSRHGRRPRDPRRPTVADDRRVPDLRHVWVCCDGRADGGAAA